MTQRKKFMFFGLGLNLLFYTGLSIALVTYYAKDTKDSLHRELRQLLQHHEMMLWERKSTALRFLKNYQEQRLPKEISTGIARSLGITAVVKQDSPQNIPLLIDQKNEPVPKTFFSARNSSILFHTLHDQSFLTFLVTQKDIPSLSTPHTITIEQPLLSLKSPFLLLRSDVSVLEKNWTGIHVLYSTLPTALREQLKDEKFFDRSLPIADEKNLFTRVPAKYQSMQLAQEKYYYFLVNLISEENLEQSVIFTMKIKDMNLFDERAAVILIFLLFCVSNALIFMTYAWSKET